MGVYVGRKVSWKQRGRLLLLLSAAFLLLGGYLFTVFRLESLVTAQRKSGKGGKDYEEVFPWSSGDGAVVGEEKRDGVLTACDALLSLADEVWELAEKEVIEDGIDVGYEGIFDEIYSSNTNQHRQNSDNKNDDSSNNSNIYDKFSLDNKESFSKNKNHNVINKSLSNSFQSGNSENLQLNSKDPVRKESMPGKLSFRHHKQILKRVCENHFKKFMLSKKTKKDFFKFEKINSEKRRSPSKEVRVMDGIGGVVETSFKKKEDDIGVDEKEDKKNIEIEFYKLKKRRFGNENTLDGMEEDYVMMDEEKLQILHSLVSSHTSFRRERMKVDEEEFEREKRRKAVRLNIHEAREGLATWKIFQNRISDVSLYDDDDDEIDYELPNNNNNQNNHHPDPNSNIKHNNRIKYSNKEMLSDLKKDLATQEITGIIELPHSGTQTKYVMALQDSSFAIFKPKRTTREQEESLDTYYMYEKERHTAEIAAHHLDRLLKFNRVPPVSGRVINMVSDLQEHMTQHSKKNFYLSPIGNLCFFGKCRYFCDPANGICGDGFTLEGSFAAFLPNKSLALWSSVKNPWSRSYSKHNKTYWEKETDGAKVCRNQRSQPPFHSLKAILNLIDIHIFDFLIGNKDRHHFTLFNQFKNSSTYVLIDNGKGFGRTKDITDILAPLFQCCLIRFTTLRTLTTFHTQPSERLSVLMDKSLSEDLLSDILTHKHLMALDRRVKIILEKVLECVSNASSSHDVIKDDDVSIT